jgi:hypothetical protein
MGMDPRRLLALHSNLMRTDVVSIRFSDSTTWDAQNGLRHTGKKCILTALLTASSKSVVSRLPSPSHYNQTLGRHACSRVTYVAHHAYKWSAGAGAIARSRHLGHSLHERPLKVTSPWAGSDRVTLVA